MDWTKDWTAYYAQAFKQLTEFQRSILTGMSSMSANMSAEQANFNPPNVREAMDNSLKFQEQIVMNSLEFQAMVARLSIESQKQLWENYFKLLGKQTEKS